MVKTFRSSASSLQILVGESASENDFLRKSHSQNDLWFHVDGAPSAHTILVIPKGSKPLRSDIEEAAQLTGFHSKQRHLSRIKIIYCKNKQVKNVVEKAGLVSVNGKPESLTVYPLDESDVKALSVS